MNRPALVCHSPGHGKPRRTSSRDLLAHDAHPALPGMSAGGSRVVSRRVPSPEPVDVGPVLGVHAHNGGMVHSPASSGSGDLWRSCSTALPTRNEPSYNTEMTSCELLTPEPVGEDSGSGRSCEVACRWTSP